MLAKVGKGQGTTKEGTVINTKQDKQGLFEERKAAVLSKRLIRGRRETMLF